MYPFALPGNCWGLRAAAATRSALNWPPSRLLNTTVLTRPMISRNMVVTLISSTSMRARSDSLCGRFIPWAGLCPFVRPQAVSDTALSVDHRRPERMSLRRR